MNIQELPVPGYEKVVRCHDEASGLVAFIGVHNTTLGPALGGIRCWHYAAEADALEDVKRLAEGMTYKSAVAETGLGGGKSVIALQEGQQKTPEMVRAMGHFIDALGGLYYGAEDVGTSVADMTLIREVTPYVTGLPIADGGSGDPSPWTALGVFEGLKASLRHVFGSDALAGRTVALKGCGSVGAALARELRKAGAALILADIRDISALAEELDAEVVDSDSIHRAQCDVFAPCALGAGLNDETIPELQCQIVAGAANNQLAKARHGKALEDRGIVYVPDFVLNAGGILNVSLEVKNERYNEADAYPLIRNIGAVVLEVLHLAAAEGIPSSEAAVVLAKRKLARGRRAR